MKKDAVQHHNIHCPLFYFFAFSIKIVKYCSCKSTNKCLSQMLMKDVLCNVFNSLETVQFQFGLNAFACSPKMVRQCVSGETKMWPIKACQGIEGRMKWCANTLLSLQWHYK